MKRIEEENRIKQEAEERAERERKEADEASERKRRQEEWVSIRFHERVVPLQKFEG